MRPKDNDYRLEKINAFVVPGPIPIAFGDKPVSSVTTDDIEAFRAARKAEGLSAVTVNHDLKLLRKMLNWGVRRGYLQRTPFKVGTESAIALEREIPRDWRLRLWGRDSSQGEISSDSVGERLREGGTKRTAAPRPPSRCRVAV